MATLNRLLNRFARADRGAEVIEFALTLPLLMLVVLGIIEFGFVFQQYEVVTNAAREGARVAVLPNYAATPTSAEANVKARVNQYLTSAGLDTASSVTTICGGTGCPGDWKFVKDTLVAGPPAVCVYTFPVTVKYQHPVPFIGGIINYFGGSFAALTLSATARMRSEAAAVGC